ncbi:MAG: hypothetical protein ACK5ZV_05325 [bacterium]
MRKQTPIDPERPPRPDWEWMVMSFDYRAWGPDVAAGVVGCIDAVVRQNPQVGCDLVLEWRGGGQVRERLAGAWKGRGKIERALREREIERLRVLGDPLPNVKHALAVCLDRGIGGGEPEVCRLECGASPLLYRERPDDAEVWVDELVRAVSEGMMLGPQGGKGNMPCGYIEVVDHRFAADRPWYPWPPLEVPRRYLDAVYELEGPSRFEFIRMLPWGLLLSPGMRARADGDRRVEGMMEQTRAQLCENDAGAARAPKEWEMPEIGWRLPLCRDYAGGAVLWQFSQSPLDWTCLDPRSDLVDELGLKSHGTCHQMVAELHLLLRERGVLL